MARIRGHFEWDDDGLTPGRRKDGSLHQNLFDSEGNLRRHARFIPDSGGDDAPLVITETVYVPVQARRKSADELQLEEDIRQIIGFLLTRGIQKARPYAEQWWRETGRPAIEARKVKVADRRAQRRAGRGAVALSAADTDEEADDQVTEYDDAGAAMSAAEAKARMLAAVAARAYCDEQLRLVRGARIVEGGGVRELERQLAELPQEQVRALVRAMVDKPASFGENALAELASVLGSQQPPSSTPMQLEARAKGRRRPAGGPAA